MTPPPEDSLGYSTMPRIRNRSPSSAGEGARLDLVYGFGWYGGRIHGEAYPADCGSSRDFACRAGGPLNFKLSHQEEKEVIDLKRDGTESASGSFIPRKSADHCLVWTNTGKHSVTLRYEFQRVSQCTPNEGRAGRYR